MATTGLWPVKSRLKEVIAYTDNPSKTTNPKYVDNDLLSVIKYAENDDKTDKKVFVSTINCPKQRPYECMMATKRRFGKTNGIAAYHGFQSFRGGEVTPEEAHQIGIETAKRMWGDKYEVVITTHLVAPCELSFRILRRSGCFIFLPVFFRQYLQNHRVIIL